MTKKIKISTKDFEVTATLLEDENPETCKVIRENLPLKGKASLYKEEIYFDIPVNIEPEKTTPNTEKGDISYWPKGPAFCVFFGESQPVSPVSTFGRIVDDVEEFREVEEGGEVVVRRVE